MTAKKTNTKEIIERKAVTLSSLQPVPGSRKRPKRRGIGEGSGLGKTAGKGTKGQKMRGGVSIPKGFEGGQMPIHRRLPKIGFTSRKKVTGQNIFEVINLAKLEGISEVTPESLFEKGLLRKKTSRLKILGTGKVSGKLTVKTHAISASARSAVENAGGEVQLIS